jgi:hypothetical protein
MENLNTTGFLEQCLFVFSTDVFYFNRCLRIYADVDEALAMKCLWHTVVFDCMIRVLFSFPFLM